ncbi:helix-turn-helix transcriptional regulator [Paenibacillus sp. GCM10023252]|uniref:helix-turn-helix transcriptional regulator n=1 Tax=Paenibacillus sp. GCM10023252 TaxID=3252649 RepID=UPI0036136BE0
MPTTFIGLSLYVIGVDRIESEVNKTHQLRLAHVTKQMEEELAGMEVRLSQWSFNPTFGEKLRNVDYSDNYSFTRELLQTLLVMQETNPLIEEVYLFIDNNRAMISSSRGVNYIAEGEQDFLTSYASIMKTDSRLFWTKSLPIPGLNSNNQSLKTDFKYSLVHKLPRDGVNSYGAIIVRLNTAKMSAYFQEFAEDGISLLMDDGGDWLIRESSVSENRRQLQDQIHDNVLKRWPNKEQDTFLTTLDRTKFSVSYSTFHRLGTDWIFMTASDISKLSGPVVLMSRLIILVNVIALATAILLAWLASRKIYKPIGQLIGAIFKDKSDRGSGHEDELKLIEKEWLNLTRESHNLQIRVEEQLPTLRESFMLQLVQGRLYYATEEELRSKIAFYGWETEHKQFTVLVVQLLGLTNAGGKFNEEDEQLVTFAAANIVEELTRLHLQQCYVVNFQDLSVGIIIGLPSGLPRSSVKKELTMLSQEMITTLNHILKLGVTVCMGQVSEELSRIPELLDEARHTLRFRNLREANQVVDMDDEVVQGNYTFRYPFELERDLIHAIRLGQPQEALAKAEEFVAELASTADVEHFMQQALAQLIGNINNTLLQAGFHVYSFHEGRNLYEEVMELRQTDEMLKWLQSTIVTPYVSEMNQTHHAQLKQTVEKVVRLVEEKYMTDLSLEECADHLGVGVSTLSKTFKQVKGIGYVDYVTKVRVDVSKKLLIETDLKISEIAEKVGYQHSWFNRVFKKSEGVTPTQYRESHQ